MHWLKRFHSLDLRARIFFVLIAVIPPTFGIVTWVENKLTKPILEEEMRQLGITTGKTLAAEIVSQKLLALPDPTPALEKYLQEFLYARPHVIRMEVLVKDALTGKIRILASNVEEEMEADEEVSAPQSIWVENTESELKEDEQGIGNWEIFLPIEQRHRDGHKKILGNIHVVVSTRVVKHILGALWKVTATGALVSVVTLILLLGFFLRRTIESDRLLRSAESKNQALTEQLHDVERELMQTEKWAAMGQLTARFAHEIGTPLTAIGGHLQLLKDEWINLRGLSGPSPVPEERFEIIQGQLQKIEQTVKNFLQSTAKPASQKQLVDLNQVIQRCLSVFEPRLQVLGAGVRLKLDRKLVPIRAVPLDVEQVLMNLVNNSLDSIKSKGRGGVIEIQTRSEKVSDGHSVTLSVYDTGKGIPKLELRQVVKPFFTTKRPQEGTGLGLTLCDEWVRRQGGSLQMDSKEGAWTKVKLEFPS